MNNKWHNVFMDEAKWWAERMSKDSTKVGCAIVSPEKPNVVLVKGYNGPPSGVVDSEWRRERPQKYLFAAHAEQNAISFAARHGIRISGATLYCTHAPCSRCTQMIIQSGIVCVVVGNGSTSMPEEEFSTSIEMFRESGVAVYNIGEFPV